MHDLLELRFGPSDLERVTDGHCDHTVRANWVARGIWSTSTVSGRPGVKQRFSIVSLTEGRLLASASRSGVPLRVVVRAFRKRMERWRLWGHQLDEFAYRLPSAPSAYWVVGFAPELDAVTLRVCEGPHELAAAFDDIARHGGLPMTFTINISQTVRETVHRLATPGAVTLPAAGSVQ